MKNFWNWVKRKDIDIMIVIFLVVSAASLFLKMNWYDEMWNFANCYKIFSGYKIYRDLNVIITPLFFFIAQVFLKIFGPTILSFKIYNICISSMLLLLIYKIFKNLNIVRRRTIAYTLIIAFFMIGIIKGGANYNVMVLIPILIQILLIVKDKENDIMTGILLFSTFMLKQNVFVYFALGIFAYKISSNGNMRKKIISLIKIYLTSILGIILFLLLLYLDNNLYNFINYCFLGLLEFKKENVIGSLLDAERLYISIISISFMLFLINNKKSKEILGLDRLKNIKVFLCLGIPLLLIAYPIFNYYHSTLASLVLIIGTIYGIEEILLKELLNKTRKKEKVVYIILIIIWLIYCLYTIIYMINVLNKDEYYFNKNEPFFGYIVQEEEVENIKTVCKFIKENKKSGIDVKILSCKANMYMVPLGINNGIFDLPNLGNFGKDGEEGLINKIKNLKNTVILIETETDKNIIGQESKKAREYILQNCEKVGEIEEYSIYGNTYE